MPYHTPNSTDLTGAPTKINPWIIGAAMGILALIGLVFAYILDYNPF